MQLCGSGEESGRCWVQCCRPGWPSPRGPLSLRQDHLGPKLLLGGSGGEGPAWGGPQVLLRGAFSPSWPHKQPWSFPASLASHTITPCRPDPCDQQGGGAEKGLGGLPPGWPHPPSTSPPFSLAFRAPRPHQIPRWEGSLPTDPTGGARLPFQ